ncbi:nephrin [Melanotaenia boesemani]|uniref:nephrin n=1 Tax=Melanotaenia boesemani TaxID=1250792 RepID=UPI001C04CEC1|nr:nephrin [Melanotaenia boesemani]
MPPGMQAQQAFRHEPRNLTVRMGATAELKCEVLRPSGTVQWVKDGLVLGPERSLPGYSRYSMTGKLKGQYNLRIENAQLEDESFYECQAGPSESSEAIISNTAWVTVLIPPSKPYFIVDMATPWVAGKKYSITCVAPDAKPEAEITLFKDGVELTGAESFTMSGSKDKLQNTHAEVKVTALSSDNGRELMCRAMNSAIARPVVTTMTMSVYFPPQPPVIAGLSKDEVRAGRILVLECESQSGNPLASLRWTKNGEVLSTTWEEDISSQKARSVLKLKITPADNQAELCCESFNMVSLSPLSVTRVMTVFFEPAELTLSGSLEAIEGQELTLSCYASSSNPPVDIRWWLGYKELNSTAPYREEGEYGGVTTISNMTHLFSREDNGLKLTCEAFNKGTHFSKIKDATIIVYYPPKRVWIDAPPENIPIRAGTTVSLVCHSTGGNPAATLSWYKNGKAVSHAQRQTSSGMGVSRELILVLTASDNMANYRCDATNEAKKTISAHTKLLVHFTAVSMKITTKQEVLRRGEELKLECLSGSSNPKANTTWSLGTFSFQGVEKAAKKDLFGGVSVTSTLSLNLSSQHHKQKVICHAYSPVLAEGAKTFYQLDVLYPPEFSSDQPTEVQVVEDDMATIPLMVSANPEEVSCIWLHHREMLVKGEDLRYHWLDDHSLEMKNVTRKDAGVYNIKCENVEGVNKTTVMLDVHYAPSVKAEKDPVFVNLGGIADLICVADANPIISGMFSWKWLGEEEVEMGEETQEDESSLLTIRDVTRAHAGLYQCIADNGIALPGSVDVRLVVQFKPQLQKGPQWRKVASRGDGTTTAELVCHAEGIPRIDFIWEKNGVLMDLENPRYEEKTVREGYFHTSTLQVVNVSSILDYAVFSCTARNSLGEDKLDIQLVSTNHPDPPSSFGQVSVTHDSVTLEWIPGFNGGLRQRFRIRYCGDRSVSFQYVDVFPPDATNFTVSGLQPVTTYNFSVNALNAIGESDYADNNAILTITTKERPASEEGPPEEDTPSASGFPTSLTVVLAVVFGALLLLNSLGCFFRLKWKKMLNQTKAGGSSVVDGQKNEEDGSSQSTVGNSNKYESREKINTAAQRTLLIDSGSETDSNLYESYAAESSHYYYPFGDYKPYLSPHPEERRGLDVIHLPVNSESHLYEEVKGGRVYQDTVASSLLFPQLLSDHTLTPHKNDWRSTTYAQGTENTRQFMAVQQPQRDYELPFELRGELV